MGVHRNDKKIWTNTKKTENRMEIKKMFNLPTL